MKATNIIVTGSGGFIGSRFIELHSSKFEKVHAISRSNYETIDELAGRSQAIVHTAYDRSDFTKNIEVLNQLVKLCISHKLKLVFISTFVVYDQQLRGELNEDSPYSTSSDPYTVVKQKCESIIHKGIESGLQVVVLQPTIVYGMNGNWTLHAAKSVATGHLYLPKAGDAICNAVHVDDVTDAIVLAIEKEVPPSTSKFIVSAEHPVTWKEFYQYHQFLVGNKTEVHDLPGAGKYSDKLSEKIIYGFMFSKPGYLMLSAAMPIVKRILGGRNKQGSLQQMIEQGKQLTAFVPKGMNRVYHSTEFTASIGKAKKLLEYQPKKKLSLFAAE